jgi:hypothetical protein
VADRTVVGMMPGDDTPRGQCDIWSGGSRIQWGDGQEHGSMCSGGGKGVFGNWYLTPQQASNHGRSGSSSPASASILTHCAIVKDWGRWAVVQKAAGQVMHSPWNRYG